MDVLEIIVGVLGSAAAAVGMVLTKLLADKARAKRDELEVKKEVERVVERMKEPPKDVLSLMRRNVAELREYYTINKQQARNAFSAAIFVCFLGFVLFGAGVVLSYVFPSTQGAVEYSTIGGAIVEVIAGLFFWLYSKSIKQINLFHRSLQETQRFLTAIQLVEKISENGRDTAYAYIIQSVVDNSIPLKLPGLEEVQSKDKQS